MQRRCGVAWGLILLAMLAFMLAAPAEASEVRVCQHRRLGEPCVTLRHGVNDLNQWGLSNRISSFSINSGQWLMCTAVNFGGRCQVFDDSRSDLRGTPFQDSISSLRPVREGGGGNWGGWGGSAGWQRLGLAVYSQPHFSGRSWVFSDDVRNLAELGLNNQISSVRVLGGRWRLCRQPFFVDCTEISGSVSDLRRIGMGNQISSIQEIGPPGWGGGPPGGGGGGWGSGGSGGGGWGGNNWAVLFDNTGFRGTTLTVTGPVSDLQRQGFANRASSLRLTPGARWQLCTQTGFRGRCRTLTGSSPNLAQQGLDRQVSSMRPLP